MFLCVLLCKAGIESSLICRPVIISRLVTRLTRASINISSFLGEADKKRPQEHARPVACGHVPSLTESVGYRVLRRTNDHVATGRCLPVAWERVDGLAASDEVQRERHVRIRGIILAALLWLQWRFAKLSR
jgi:hypothetical protein